MSCLARGLAWDTMNPNACRAAMYLPLFIKTEQLRCLVVGGGAVAARKVELLLASSCSLTVVAPEAGARIRTAAGCGLLTWHAREFRDGDCAGFQLVIAATPHEVVNRIVSVEARKLGIPVNVVDSPQLCTAIFGATWREGPLVVSISSSSRAPFMASAVRDRIGEAAGGMGRWIEAAGQFRAAVRAEVREPTARVRLYRLFAKCSRAGPPAALPQNRTLADWLEWLERCRTPD